jgi:antitoxin component HigA of HigAB toxin-antitoxin module
VPMNFPSAAAVNGRPPKQVIVFSPADDGERGRDGSKLLILLGLVTNYDLRRSVTVGDLPDRVRGSTILYLRAIASGTLDRRTLITRNTIGSIGRPYHGKKMIRPIRSDADYGAAVKEIERYFENEPKPGTPEGDRFDLLALIIEDYERKRWPIEPPDTIDAIRYRIERAVIHKPILAGCSARASGHLTF